MNRRLLLWIGLLSAQMLGSEVSAKAQDYSKRLAVVEQFAGEPVEYVRFGIPQTVYDWEPFGNTAILIWNTRTKAYLVDLQKSDACSQLDWDITIRVDGNGNNLDIHNGYIDLAGGGWCKMIKIRPVDAVGLRNLEMSKRTEKIK